MTPHVLRWESRAEDGPNSPPFSLAPYTRQSVLVEVPPHQVALLVRERGVAAVLLPNVHAMQVAAFGDQVGGQTGSRPGPRPDDLLVFVRSDELAPVAWATQDEEPLAGRAILRITGARLFYESFLRHSEDVSRDRFEEICSLLMTDVATRSRADLHGGSGPDALRARIETCLRRLGLTVAQLRLEGSKVQDEAAGSLQPVGKVVACSPCSPESKP